MKIAIVGSRRYENKKKIKDFVFKLKQQYGDVVRLHDKLKNISQACTCKEDSNG